MKVFKNLSEIKPYYNENTNTYEFVENESYYDEYVNYALVENERPLDVIFEFDLEVNSNIYAGNINAWNINAVDINALNISAIEIKARDISYYAVCFAEHSFKCRSVVGKRKNAKHFCLDNDVEYTSGDYEWKKN